jgi:hypothetical protein
MEGLKTSRDMLIKVTTLWLGIETEYGVKQDW